MFRVSLKPGGDDNWDEIGEEKLRFREVKRPFGLGSLGLLSMGSRRPETSVLVTGPRKY